MRNAKKGNGFDSMGLRLTVPTSIYDACYGYIDWLKVKGIDLFYNDMILYPHCQGFNGGGLIDGNAQTEFENLFACGEAAGGMHGADRIGGNAISAGLVFGEIAGREAAKKIKHEIPARNTVPHKDYCTELRNLIEKNYSFGDAKGSIFPGDVKKTIKDIMHHCAGIVRCGQKLTMGISQLRELYRQFDVLFWIEAGYTRKALEAANCIIAAEVVLSAIENRKDSRGSHYRKDYPFKDSMFGKWSITKWDRECGGLTDY